MIHINVPSSTPGQPVKVSLWKDQGECQMSQLKKRITLLVAASLGWQRPSPVARTDLDPIVLIRAARVLMGL